MFWRPTNTSNKLVTPQNLREHCQALVIPGPGCLCPLKDASLGPFVEASISFKTCLGSDDKEYVAECSAALCGYSGKQFWDKSLNRLLMNNLARLQHIYLWKIRNTALLASSSSHTFWEDSTLLKRPGASTSNTSLARKSLKRSYASLGQWSISPLIIRYVMTYNPFQT